MIVTSGKRRIGDAISAGVASHIAVGVGSAESTMDMNRLQFEVERAPIDFAVYDPNTDEIHFKATFREDLDMTITEVALIYAVGNENVLVFTADDQFESWSGGTWQTTNARIGANGIGVTGATATLNNANLSVYQFGAQDKIYLAYNGGAGTVTVRLLTDSSNYYEYTFAAASGYNVHEQNFGDMTSVGTPDPFNIRNVSIEHSGATGIVVDAMRIEKSDGGDELVVRRKLDTPINKEVGYPLDIEMALTL